MSTNHTTNYNLNQWEAADKVLRTEFNADNAKIDAALKANADAVAALDAEKAEATDLEALSQTVAGKAEKAALDAVSQAVNQRALIVLGTYEGDGKDEKFVDLGATPQAVLVVEATGYMSSAYVDYHFGGLALAGAPVTIKSDGTGRAVVKIVDNGFQVYYWRGDDEILTNEKGSSYHYLAVM